MDVGGILANALGGGAQAVQGMAQGYIEDERKTDVAKTLSDMEEAKQQRIAQFQQNLQIQGKQREQDRVKGIIGGATGKEAVSKLMAAGDVANADAVMTTYDKGIIKTGYGGAAIDNNGPVPNVLFDSTQTRAGAAAAGKRADHFNEKEWDEGRKADKDWFKIDDPLSGKSQYVPQLNDAFMTRYAQLQQRGDMTPTEARANAYNFATGLQERAQAVMAEPANKNLTMQQAIGVVKKRMNEASNPTPAPTPTPTPTPQAAPAAPKAAAPPDSTQGVQLDQARAASKAAYNKLMSYGSRQKAADPAGFAAAQTAYDQAKQLEVQAESEYRQSIANSPQSAAFRYPAP